MAVIQSGASSTTLMTVDPTFAAGRVAARPPEILGAYQINATTGATTTIAAAGPLFGFRWSPATSTNLCMIRRVEVGYVTTTAFTTAQNVGLNMVVARGFTGSFTGATGTPVDYVISANQKLRTSMPPSAFSTGGQIRIAGTAVLSGQTYTLDTYPIASVYGWAGAAGTTIPTTTLYQQQTSDYPLIFAANEGFIISNAILGGAAGVLTMYVNVTWFELAATGTAVSY